MLFTKINVATQIIASDMMISLIFCNGGKTRRRVSYELETLIVVECPSFESFLHPIPADTLRLAAGAGLSMLITLGSAVLLDPIKNTRISTSTHLYTNTRKINLTAKVTKVKLVVATQLTLWADCRQTVVIA